MPAAPAVRLINILLVEDSPGDVLLTKEALREVQVANELSVARDGEEAMAFLRKRKPVDLNRFLEVVRSIEDYWIGFVALPPR